MAGIARCALRIAGLRDLGEDVNGGRGRGFGFGDARVGIFDERIQWRARLFI
jgi:CRISPR/Cas system endoribonuclease Cas6 (RAMP superfamily)